MESKQREQQSVRFSQGRGKALTALTEENSWNEDFPQDIWKNLKTPVSL